VAAAAKRPDAENIPVVAARKDGQMKLFTGIMAKITGIDVISMPGD